MVLPLYMGLGFVLFGLGARVARSPLEWLSIALIAFVLAWLSMGLRYAAILEVTDSRNVPGVASFGLLVATLVVLQCLRLRCQDAWRAWHRHRSRRM